MVQSLVYMYVLWLSLQLFTPQFLTCQFIEHTLVQPCNGSTFMETYGIRTRTHTYIHTYVVGSKSFRPDIQKQRQMENAVRDI